MADKSTAPDFPLTDEELPSFPRLASAVLQMLRDEDVHLGEVGEVLAQDPGLSVQFLALANSAAFATRHRVSNLRHATTLLGRNQVEQHLLACAIRRALPDARHSVFDPRRFWRSSVRRAAIAGALAGELDPAIRHECFTAALLEDMAVPLLLNQRGDEYVEALKRHEEDHVPLDELEREAFGWDHSEVGAWMAGKWELPQIIADAVATHHAPLGQGSGALAPVQAVGAMQSNDEQGDEQLIELAESRLHIPGDWTRELLSSLDEEVDELVAAFL